MCHSPQHEHLVSRISVKAGSLVVTIANSWLACLQRNENKTILCLNNLTKSLLRIFQLSQPVHIAIPSDSGAVGCVSDDSKQLSLISSLAWLHSYLWVPLQLFLCVSNPAGYCLPLNSRSAAFISFRCNHNIRSQWPFAVFLLLPMYQKFPGFPNPLSESFLNCSRRRCAIAQWAWTCTALLEQKSYIYLQWNKNDGVCCHGLPRESKSLSGTPEERSRSTILAPRNVIFKKPLPITPDDVLYSH